MRIFAGTIFRLFLIFESSVAFASAEQFSNQMEKAFLSVVDERLSAIVSEVSIDA